MSNCIFCKIVAHEVPNYTVYEDEHALAFLDIFPVTKGHVVVIPKKHFMRAAEVPDAIMSNLSIAVKRTMERIQQVLQPDGFNVGWNDGTSAGQAVPHLHIHIFPRFTGDGGKNMHAIIKNPSAIPVAEIAKLFAPV